MRCPVAGVDRPKADGRDPIILNADQYEALLTACDHPMLRMYALIVGEAGLRCKSEAAWLMWDDVDFAVGAIRVTSGRGGHGTKSGKSRFVPMTPRLASALRQHFVRYRAANYTNGVASPWVLHHTITRCHHVAGERIGSLHSAFQSAAKRAKLPAGLHQHDLRHKRVTDWLAAGRSPVAVMHAMGHSDIKTTTLYYRFVPGHLRALVTEEPTPLRVVPNDAAREVARG